MCVLGSDEKEEMRAFVNVTLSHSADEINARIECSETDFQKTK